MPSLAPVILAALLACAPALPCPCEDTSLCATLALPPRDEVFLFQVDVRNWPSYDYSRVTSIALFDGAPPPPEFLCFAHSKAVNLVANAPYPSSQLLNATYRSAFLEGMKALVNGTRYGVQLDGLNFDIEDPFGGAQAEGYVRLLEFASAALKQAMGPAFSISVDVAWSPDCIDGRCYNLAGMAAAADLLFVMAYDMRSQVFPPQPCLASANSPFPLVTQGMLNYTQQGLGLDPRKLILGLPWYGYRYECAGPDVAPDAAVCPMASVPFRNASCSDAAGSELCYSALMQLLRNTSHPPSRAPSWNASLAATFFNRVEGGKTVQYWYDTPASLQLKAKYAGVAGWRGTGVWNADCLDYASTDARVKADTQRMWESFDAFQIDREL